MRPKTPQFTVRYESQPAAADLWDWSIWIEPTAGDLDALEEVRWVMYGLHPCFPNPNRVIRNRQGGFRLTMRSANAIDATWGSFQLRVTIGLGSARELHDVTLEFPREDGSVAPPLLPLPDRATYAQAERYYKLLKRKGAFGYALEVLGRAQKLLDTDSSASRTGERANKILLIAQQRALCTYKNGALPTRTRLQAALEILRAPPCDLDLETCGNAETLGLGGAVYKRLWEIDRSRADLDLALAYYRQSFAQVLRAGKDPAFEPGPDFDGGAFAGANVIYLCEVAACETSFAVDPVLHDARLREANDVRLQLARALPKLSQARPDDWWIAATLIDVYAGLASTDASYEKAALEQARLAARIARSEWETQSSGAQLVRNSQLRRLLYPRQAQRIDELTRSVIAAAFGRQFTIWSASFDGKLGLALSGGGFRASLFHIGVIARLAELDLLRHVEVISCVSGGSIVGAHYYLLLRHLLQSKPDLQIHRKDYLDLVETLLEQFLRGVRKNIRMRVPAGLWSNLRMLLQPATYSRTQRLGQLYEDYLYSQVDDGEQSGPRWLNEVFITPKKDADTFEDAFSPRQDNWRRSAKVPMLVLNSTSLNTGRNWEFTASWLGEPVSYGSGVDSTERLEPVYYSEAPEALRQYRLGHAVAASSCVPALFTPIAITGLYPDRTVRLVDGGLHDNQGTRSLLDQDCDSIIASDASGQMPSQRNPSHGELGVMLRSNSVLQARVRIAEHQELEARQQANLLRKCAFLHLRKSVEATPVPAVGAYVGSAVESAEARKPGAMTDYGVDRDAQLALSSLRTDLDSFTDREALSLMYSGYVMSRKYLGDFADGNIPTARDWRFLRVGDAMTGRDAPGLSYQGLMRHLRIGSKLAFKVWFLSPVLATLGIALLSAAGIAVLWGLWQLAQSHATQSVNLSSYAWSVLGFIALTAFVTFFPWLRRLARVTDQAMHPGTVLARWVAAVFMATGGWLLCWLHLSTFNRLFLRLGKVPETSHFAGESPADVVEAGANGPAAGLPAAGPPEAGVAEPGAAAAGAGGPAKGVAADPAGTSA
jgi:predicted acylesterase/phospholipase RssA